MRAARNILHLGIKELRSLLRDPFLVFFIIYGTTLNIYTAATAMPESEDEARPAFWIRLVAEETMRPMTAGAPSSARVGMYSRERISPSGETRAETILLPPRSTARTGLAAD